MYEVTVRESPSDLDLVIDAPNKESAKRRAVADALAKGVKYPKVIACKELQS